MKGLSAIQVTQPVTAGLLPRHSFLAPANKHLNDTDYALARAAATGATDAVADLYRHHSLRVYALCLRMTRNPEDAEDLTQEVFIHLLRKVQLFRGESRFTTWLHRLTVNLVLMHFRRWAARKELQITDTLDVEDAITLRHGQSNAVQLADRMILNSALAQLSPGCRSVLVLFDIEGYKHEEIARLLGCSVGTSKSQLHRARMKLRRLLGSVH
ncbi:MAG TPA: sigma-70 family RNA polymerase sigma factor [Pyrinomonadaceae bacterium]|nr:sigma-70 family RNA polymerase sigma factor [Pyrinomonadaceae bacterium]